MPRNIRDDEKQLLIMRYEQKMSCREIGEALGISEATSRTRLSRLTKKLRKYFDKETNCV